MTDQINLDTALGVTIPSRNARGRLARIGPSLDSILANHAYPPVIERLLAEALVLTLSATTKLPNTQFPTPKRRDTCAPWELGVGSWELIMILT